MSGNAKVGNRNGVLGRWQHIEYVVGFNLDRRLFDLAQCMPTVPGAIGAFRRNALLQVGGVTDDTLAEDTDLTMALCRDGWRVVYEETRQGLDRGAELAGSSVAAALSLVLRHAAGDVEAPRCPDPARTGGPVRPPRSRFPARLPGPAAAARTGRRRLRPLRPDLPRSAARRRPLAGLRGACRR